MIAEALPQKKEMTMWAIYNSPSDYPGQIVARRFVVTPGKVVATPTLIFWPLEEMRKAFRSLGCLCMTRMPEDDPTILEVWL
jgi:hypothetical protein